MTAARFWLMSKYIHSNVINHQSLINTGMETGKITGAAVQQQQQKKS